MADKCLCVTESTIFSWFLYSEKTSASYEKMQVLIDIKEEQQKHDYCSLILKILTFGYFAIETSADKVNS